MCNHDMARQLMAEQLAVHGAPVFRFDGVMAPFGIDAPFYAGWNIERDWIGARIWAWDRDFPFYWSEFGISLLLCYSISGFLLRRMGLGTVAAWTIALCMAGFNVPRHLKLWHHSDNVMLHWAWAGFLLDALIWQRFIRERRISIHLEAWRGVTLAGMLWTMGYTWGPSMLSFELAHGWMAVLFMIARRHNKNRAPGQVQPYRIDWQPRQMIMPIIVGVTICIVDLRFYLPLASAMQSLSVSQGAGFQVSPDHLLRPLFLEQIANLLGVSVPLAPFWEPETVTAIGWSYWIPFVLAIIALRRAQATRIGPGLLSAAPLLCSVALGILYFTPLLEVITRPLFVFVPFMRFFRTTCRFAIYLPPLMTLTVVLAWPELRALAGNERTRRWIPWAVALFAAIAVLEASVMLRKTGSFPPVPSDVQAMFARIKALPGDTVLTLPFCVAGANGICTAEQCPGYPAATVAHCTRLFHDKKVYGSYTARMSERECDLYRKAPYTGWHSAWRNNHCFNDDDWDGLCKHLASQPGIAAVLVLPDIWKAADEQACASEFVAHLGRPIAEVTFPKFAIPSSRVQWYAPRCR